MLSGLACLAWRLNGEVDSGSHVSIEAASKAIESGRVISFIKQNGKLEGSSAVDLGLLDSEDEITISEAFGRIANCLTPERYGVTKNGFAWLLVLTIELIRMEEWTSFSDKAID